MPGIVVFVMAGIGESDIVAVGFEVADTAALGIEMVVVGIGESDIVVVADIAALVGVGTAVAGIAVPAVPIVYPSCSLFRLPSDHLSTHPHPYPYHNLPLGIMGSHAFACIVLPKMVLFRTL